MENKKTLETTPEYFGSYLNLARLNVFNISNHLANKFEIVALDEEGNIPTSFLTDGKNKTFIAKQTHVFDQLKRYMPVVKLFDDELLPKSEQEKLENKKGKDFAKLTATLKVVFKELNLFRNDYTHYYSKTNKTNRKLIISDELKVFLNMSYEYALLYTQSRFKDVFKEEDFITAQQAQLIKDDNVITQDGLVFLTTMFLDRENAFSFINKITGLKGTQHTAFKVKREVLCAYCVNLPHDKFISEDAKQSFSLELINELNKCPKTLFDVITDEAKKEFQPELGDEEKERLYQNSLSPYADEKNMDSIDDYENYINDITKRVRNTNRFSYFAMKFIDQNDVFKTIRFQLDLGKFILDDYSKSFNGVEEPRRVVERAMAFDKLQNVLKEEDVLKRINTGTVSNKFEQFAPHYNFDTNKIGLKLAGADTAKLLAQKDSSKKVISYLQQPTIDAFLSVHELPKIILLNYLQKGSAEQIIKDFIQINNTKLFTKEFIELIKSQLTHFDVFDKRSQGRKQDKGAYPQGKLNHLASRKQKLNELLAAHHLNDKQIPTRILDYWLNIEDVTNKIAVSDRIKLMKRDCIDRLKDIKKNKTPRVGEMATFLAKDIVDMIIDVNKKKKITSFYYDKMQQCLALYADTERKTLFIQIIKELELNKSGGHPFLHKIDFENYRYTADIYKAYLEEKGQKLISEVNPKNGKKVVKDISWLEKNFYTKEWNEEIKKQMTIVKIPNDITKIPFTILQFDKEKSTFDIWFENVTKGKALTNDRKKPIDLPTNLFDGVLKELLVKELSNKSILFDLGSNYNELFKLWWEKCREDSTQSFYNSGREYTFEDFKLNFVINTKDKFEHYISNSFVEKVKTAKQEKQNIEKQLPHNIGKRYTAIDTNQVKKSLIKKIGTTEKEIRIQQEEDRLMLLMFEQMTSQTLHPKLKTINILLNETIPIKEPINGLLSFNDLGQIIKDKKEKKLIVKYLVEERKRKDYSVLKKYIFDRRLPELFEYFEEDEISIEILKKEVESYNKSRDIVFDSIFKIEQAIILKNEQELVNSSDDENNISHKTYLNWLLLNDYISQEEYVFFNMVRNTFSHNQFPQRKTIERYMKLESRIEIASQIATKFVEKVNGIITQMQS